MPWPWDDLGIEPTSVTREIRRAYNRRLKGIDAEHEPAAFQRLREAYEAATARAEASEPAIDHSDAKKTSFEEATPSRSARAEEPITDLAVEPDPGTSSAPEDTVTPTEVQCPATVDMSSEHSGHEDNGGHASSSGVEPTQEPGERAASIAAQLRETRREDGDGAAAVLLRYLTDAGEFSSIREHQALEDELLAWLEAEPEPLPQFVLTASRVFDWTTVGTRVERYPRVAARVETLFRRTDADTWLRRRRWGVGASALAARLLRGQPSRLRLVLAAMRPGVLRSTYRLLETMEEQGIDWRAVVNPRVLSWWRWVAAMSSPSRANFVIGWLLSSAAAAVICQTVLVGAPYANSGHLNPLQLAVVFLVPLMAVRLARAVSLVWHWLRHGSDVNEGPADPAMAEGPTAWVGPDREKLNPETDRNMLAYYFGGRLSRLQFLGQIGLAVCVVFAASLGLALTEMAIPVPEKITQSVSVIAVASLYTWLASAGAKRLHDIGLSAGYYLLVLLPILGWIIVPVMLLFVRGNAETNPFGPPPARNRGN